MECIKPLCTSGIAYQHLESQGCCHCTLCWWIPGTSTSASQCRPALWSQRCHGHALLVLTSDQWIQLMHHLWQRWYQMQEWPMASLGCQPPGWRWYLLRIPILACRKLYWFVWVWRVLLLSILVWLEAVEGGLWFWVRLVPWTDGLNSEAKAWREFCMWRLCTRATALDSIYSGQRYSKLLVWLVGLRRGKV